MKEEENKTLEPWVTSMVVSRYYNIHGYNLRQLREKLKGTPCMKQGNGGLWLFKLTCLQSMQGYDHVQVPDKLIKWL